MKLKLKIKPNPNLKILSGVHKGKRIRDLPTSYLKWCAENLSEKNPVTKALCLAADAEYMRRKNGEVLDTVVDEDEEGFLMDDDDIEMPLIDPNFVV